VIKPNYRLIESPAPVPFLRSAKGFVLKVANRTGVSTALASSKWRQQRLLILCYHGVSQLDEHEWSDLYVSPEKLEQRLELLRNTGTTVLPLDEAIERLYQGNLPQQSVSLTFDDGACDFAIKAAPLLKAANAHSTVYFTTSYCGRNTPVFAPFLSYLLWKGRGRTVLLPGIDARVTIPQFTISPEFFNLHDSLLQYTAAAGLDVDEKHEFARIVARATGADFEELSARRIMSLMNAEEVRSLDPNLVSLQLHTHNHRTPASLEEVHNELGWNAAAIARITGRKETMSHFCYPSGRYSPELMEWLRIAGIRSATTCVPNYATSETLPLGLPRFVDTMSVSADTFEAWVKGTAAFTLRRAIPTVVSATTRTIPAPDATSK